MRIGLTHDHCSRQPTNCGPKDCSPEDCSPQTSSNVASDEEMLDKVCNALSAAGHSVVRIGNAIDLVDRLAAGERVDLVFNLCSSEAHDFSWAHVPALLDAYNIPTTLSNPLTMCLCQQTRMMQSLLRENGIPVCDQAPQSSANGLSETEYVVAITGSANEAEALGTSGCETLGMASQTESQTTIELLQRTALAAWRTLHCQDAGCVYLRVDADGRAQVVRIDPVPRLSAEPSDFMKIADSRGVTLEKLVETIVQSATRRASAPNDLSSLKPPRPHLASTPARERAT